MVIYLDHAATTPMRREVLDAMLPYLTDAFGNPSSAHAFGRAARSGLDEAHEVVARCLGAEPREIVFTSGGTEASNLAIKGAAWAARAMGDRIITSAVEHHGTLYTVRHLEKWGFQGVELPVDRYGRVDPDQLAAALDERTILVTLQLANNEVGTIQPIEECVRRVRAFDRRIVIHLDAVQAAPYVPVDVHELGVDLLSIAGHKFEGPKGCGALYVKRGTTLLPQTQGGSQERHRRAGTENVAGAVGLASALRLCVEERGDVLPRLAGQRDRIRDALLAVGGVELTGHPLDRLAGHLSVVCRGVDGTSLALSLDLHGIAVSTGSACSTGDPEPSHVLSAMGYPPDEARGALRLSLGRTTTDDEVERVCAVVPGLVERMREAERAVAVDPLGQRALA